MFPVRNFQHNFASLKFPLCTAFSVHFCNLYQSVDGSYSVVSIENCFNVFKNLIVKTSLFGKMDSLQGWYDEYPAGSECVNLWQN